MHTRWNDTVVQDYELSRPDATPLELDLYTTSLTTWPTVLIGDPATFGTLRRTGIVDIPVPEHERLAAALAAHLAAPARVRALIAAALAREQRSGQALATAEQALDHADAAAASASLADATGAFLKVMSTHIVNWLLPEQRWEDTFTRLLDNRHAARECLLALATPDDTGHLLDAHQGALHAAAAVRAGRPLQHAAAEIAARAGTLYGVGSPAVAAMPLEDPANAAHLIQGLLEENDHERQLAAIAAGRSRALLLRDAWQAAALLAAAGDDRDVSSVRATVLVLGWAAGSEERRKVLRHRYLAAGRRWCHLTDRDPTSVTTTDLLTAGAAR
ncbi:hypothetical protein [Kitasatospora sp. NPDC059327]|uniref:hypothetical protein n=1 Tax=Kitasatospora sp. NPDC059327 TaxID=3346803 RepID=UPI00369BEDBF